MGVKYLEVCELNHGSHSYYSYFFPYDETVTEEMLIELEDYVSGMEFYWIPRYDLDQTTVDLLLDVNKYMENGVDNGSTPRFNLKKELLTGSIVEKFLEYTDDLDPDEIGHEVWFNRNCVTFVIIRNKN